MSLRRPGNDSIESCWLSSNTFGFRRNRAGAAGVIKPVPTLPLLAKALAAQEPPKLMKATRIVRALGSSFIPCLCFLAAPLAAQQPSFSIQMQTNREALLRLTATSNAYVRIDATA